MPTQNWHHENKVSLSFESLHQSLNFTFIYTIIIIRNYDSAESFHSLRIT